MRLIVIPDIAQGDNPAEPARLKQALSAQPLNLLMMEAARRTFCAVGASEPVPSDIAWVIPPQWKVSVSAGGEQILRAEPGQAIQQQVDQGLPRDARLVLSHGCFATQVDPSLLEGALSEDHADVVAIQVDPRLRAHQERIRLTSEGDLVGCRRLYRDVAEPVPPPVETPHHLFIEPACVARLLQGGSLRSLDEVWARCRTLDLKIRSFALAGTCVDLASSRGLLTLCGWILSEGQVSSAVSALLCDRVRGSDGVAPDARMIGPVLVGRGARVEPGAVVIGPAVLCSGSTIHSQALVDASIIGEGIAVERDRRLAGVCLMTPEEEPARELDVACEHFVVAPRSRSEFRTWSRFSYARCLKRVGDIIMALFVLLLFAPIIPFVALAIRINSPGPIFYKDRRQGLHGRPFHCIKFRTMRVGAAAIQDKLRFVSEVDGPQFKINDDPRISGVGRFLRETSIDEIPQFFNVLAGQMSVIGPRPSPEAENTQCPSWRDARLSVRPGITGLWQVCRTRQPFKDFQEWIYYDTKYVRELSLWNDVRICVRTFRHLFGSFVEQF